MLSAGMNEMKIKRINYFGKKTIKKFIIQLNFNRDFELLDILKIAEFAKSIEEDIANAPTNRLSTIKGIGSTLAKQIKETAKKHLKEVNLGSFL